MLMKTLIRLKNALHFSRKVTALTDTDAIFHTKLSKRPRSPPSGIINRDALH